MMQKARFISTAIPYVNADPHIGFAFECVLADVLTRSYRLAGDEVYFLSGTDDNALKNVQAAEAAGVPVEKFVPEKAKRFKELLRVLQVETTDYLHTSSDARHTRGAQKLWQACTKDIEKRSYWGLYCVGCEEFKRDMELQKGECPEHPGKKVEEVEEENYFFRLDRYQNQLKNCIESDMLKITPGSRKKEMLAFINGGLEPFSISRTRERARGWGVPVPGDSSQIMYVWFDALSNYINALGYADEGENFKKYWQNGETLHVIGKGINRFHTIYWPAMLLSAGIALPKQVLVHGYVTVGGQKMSKSLGNVTDPFELVEEYGVDAVRYFLLRHITTVEDGDFTLEKFKEAYNGNLANGLGNLVARVMQLAQTHLAEPVKVEFVPYPKEFIEALEQFEINKAADYVWSRIGTLDRRITKEEPFKLIKTDAARGKKLISELVHELAAIDLMLEPLLPHTSKRIIKAIMANKKPGNLFPKKD